MPRQKLIRPAAKGHALSALSGQDTRMHLNDTELADDAPESEKALGLL